MWIAAESRRCNVPTLFSHRGATPLPNTSPETVLGSRLPGFRWSIRCGTDIHAQSLDFRIPDEAFLDKTRFPQSILEAPSLMHFQTQPAVSVLCLCFFLK